MSTLFLAVYCITNVIANRAFKENFTKWKWKNELSCSSDMDCSLNGKCNTSTGTCDCRIGWISKDCSVLNLLPAEKKSGYHYESNGKNVSSWGGMAVYSEEDDQWHMLASEMKNHCGINSWLGNSQIIHATSKTGDGDYSNSRVEILFPLFSHEPDLIRGPNKEFIAFYTSCYYMGPPPVMAGYNGTCDCVDGSTPNNQTQCSDRNWNESLPTYMSYTMDMGEGAISWSNPVIIPSTSPLIDTNMAGIVFQNSTFHGLYRDDKNDMCHIVHADDWKDNSTYTEYLSPLGIGDEDPFVYLDVNSYFHVLVHQEAQGVHGFSLDGWTWYTNDVGTYPAYINFTDGTSETFLRRERPHIIFDKDGTTPIALTNGATYYDGTSEYKDASYTSLQPIKH